jgi:glutaredoxin
VVAAIPCGYDRAVLALYQAEWCPYSSRVRQTLTEYGVDFVAKQVAAERRDREAMRAEIGTDAIPLLVLEDGTRLDDWQEILVHIRGNYERRADADRHREKWFEDTPRRDPNHVLT